MSPVHLLRVAVCGAEAKLELNWECSLQTKAPGQTGLSVEQSHRVEPNGSLPAIKGCSRLPFMVDLAPFQSLSDYRHGDQPRRKFQLSDGHVYAC